MPALIRKYLVLYAEKNQYDVVRMCALLKCTRKGFQRFSELPMPSLGATTYMKEIDTICQEHGVDIFVFHMMVNDALVGTCLVEGTGPEKLYWKCGACSLLVVTEEKVSLSLCDCPICKADEFREISFSVFAKEANITVQPNHV